MTDYCLHLWDIASSEFSRKDFRFKFHHFYDSAHRGPIRGYQGCQKISRLINNVIHLLECINCHSLFVSFLPLVLLCHYLVSFHVSSMGGAVSAGENNDELVDNLKEAGYIRSENVEQAFRDVDRSEYFPEGTKQHAYKDVAWKHKNVHLSAPCIYSEVMESLELESGLSFLNLGCGTGYLSTLAGLIIGPSGINHGIEIFEEVVEYAERKLEVFMNTNPAFKGINFCVPVFVVGNCLAVDYYYRQYDRVYCGAACPPEYEDYMKSLVKNNGILVMPFKDNLCKMRKVSDTEWTTESVLPVSFAPLIGIDNSDHTPLIQIASKIKSLQDLCRLVILEQVGMRRLKKIVELPLPASLLSYLSYFREN